MLISLNWLRDFVDIPADADVHSLAERFTTTCAEVEDVTHIEEGGRTPAETVATAEDWVIEIDNKSITHRPDLWGHYGIARETAAMLKLPLKSPALAENDLLVDESRPEIPIEIDDPQLCPRYSGIMLEGVSSKPSSLDMQARLAAVGIRPINALVDMTNYVMAELGQPMHAFDGDKVSRIEVAVSRPGEKFVTLDGVERTLPAGALMIQSARRNVALAGIMGGLDTEVTPATRRILLESANFDAATIRRCAATLGHRTDASARFEKSLDPALTVPAIARFIHLARQQFPDLRLTSRLSDCFPNPPQPRCIRIEPGYVAALIGKSVSLAQMKDILEALEFKVDDHDDHVEVMVPSFRATKDIEGQADVIEEIARFVGYENIEPQLPHATVRHFEPNAMHRLERQTLRVLCLSEGYHEIHDYNWYHDDWLRRLGYDPGESITLKNPAAAGMNKLRKTLAPGLLYAAELNRRELPTLKLLNIGSVFDGSTSDAAKPDDLQRRHLGLLSMIRNKKAEDHLLDDMKGSLCKWTRELFGRDLSFVAAGRVSLPWEHPQKRAGITLGDREVGRISATPLDLRRKIDEHFAAWSVVLAELNLTALADCTAEVRKLPPISEFPVVELDFSILVDAAGRYEELSKQLGSFEYPLLRRLTFEGSYQGGSLPPGHRSILLRACIADDRRTLTDEDISAFSSAFERFLTSLGLELRR